MKRAWLVLAACGGHASNAPVGERIAPALTAALTAADGVAEPWPCAAPDGPSAADETITTGARTWQLGDHAMKLVGEPPTELAIGVIADAAGSAPATLAALGRLRGKLAHVDLVITLGGMGSTRGELEAIFAALTDRASWPLVVLPGDLEPASGQIEAIAATRQRGGAVFDGRLIRRIELAAATIAVIPGASAVSRLAAGADGCIYRGDDVTAAFTDLTPRPGLRILASAEAPRALDAAGEPSGELALTAAAGQALDLALHGPTPGAGGELVTPARNGSRDGSGVALSPGSSTATPRLPGARRSPTAGVLTLRGNAWSWRPIADVQ